MEEVNGNGADGGALSDDPFDRPRRAVPVAPPCQRIKVLSCGDAGVGKSCLIKRFCEKRFVPAYVPTVGVDFGVTSVKVKHTPVKVNYYDLAGAPSFADVRCEFYSDTGAMLLVFDLTSRKSFEALAGWLDEARQHAPDIFDTATVVVCGNKVDVAGRVVQEAEARLWCESRGLYYHETSALNGQGVEDAFARLHASALAAAVGAAATPAPRPSFSQFDVDAIERVMAAKSDSARLGITQRASKEEITKAYRGLAAALHPDKNRAPGAEEAFKAITTARTSLISAATDKKLPK